MWGAREETWQIDLTGKATDSYALPSGNFWMSTCTENSLDGAPAIGNTGSRQLQLHSQR